MPPDDIISDEECDTYCKLLDWFTQNPDARCLHLLINSVSKNTTLGMYEDISSVILAHERKDVIPHLVTGLNDGNDGVKYRCCWWATDVDAWDLAPHIDALSEHVDEDVRNAALAFLELKKELA